MSDGRSLDLSIASGDSIPPVRDKYLQVVEVDALRNGNYCVTVGGKMIERDLSAHRTIQWLMKNLSS